MTTQEIKELIKSKRIFRYEIADVMGISESKLSVLLRKELSEDTEKEIMDAIKVIITKEN